jgi:hypothetical protein
MTGRSVASGIHDHGSIAQLRHSVRKEGSADCWRYMKSQEYKVESMMAIWAACDAKYACVTSSGTRNMPKNYVRAGLGVGLRAADTIDRHLSSADADGMKGAMTDISPPRWSE